MNRFTTRGFSLLLALALCVSLLSGLSFVSSAATVEYVYGSYEDFTNVIYNWGMRGATATFLSPNAEDYYEAKGTSYEELAALAGSTALEILFSLPILLLHFLQILRVFPRPLLTSLIIRPPQTFQDCK